MPRPDRIDVLPARLDGGTARSRRCRRPQSLAAANKRIVNILRKAESEVGGSVDRSAARRRRRARRCIARSTAPARRRNAHLADGDYTGALLALASAKPTVDRFFDDVMVMADDPAVRANRLALLREVARR